MLNQIIDFSVKNKLVIFLFVLALIGIGIYQVKKLPIDAVPDITDNQVQVITTAPSYGALDIERQITFPIEQNCNNIAGLKLIRSFSRFGLSLVTIVFQDDVDIYWARQQVAERLQQAQNQIPKGIGTPELGPISTGLGEIYQYVLRPKKGYEKKYDAMELRTMQDWIVRRQLLGVKGVAEVSSFGGKLKQYEISIDPNKLNALGITVQDVFDALEKNNQNTGGAYIEKGPTVLYIRSEGLIKSVDDIQQIAIQNPNNDIPLFIRDIAEVKLGYATRYGALCYNDQGEVAGAVVMMLKGANSSEVIKTVKARIAEIQKTLPEGVEIEPFLDRTKMVNNAIGTVEKNLLEGALIVVFILVLFLGNLRAGLLVASVIPLSMLFAVCMMNLFGVSGNLMSLGALDFGLIVDGAVIIVESVMHYIWHNKKFQNQTSMNQWQMDDLVTTSAKKMMNSAVFGQIVILIVYLPIFTLQGIEGKMFKPMAQTVAFALLGAFLLSLTYIPMMTALVLSHKTKHEASLSDRFMARLESFFSQVLIKVIHARNIVMASVVVLFVVSIIMLSQSGGEFIPALEEGDFAVDVRVLTGSNLNTTIEYTQKAAHIIKSQFPEVEKVVTKIGSGEVPTDPMPMEASDMMVILKDKKQWTSAKTFPELEEKMSQALEAVPGITAGFQFPVQMRFNELMTGARQDVVCKIYGENLDTLSAYAAHLGKVIRTIQGAENLYIESVLGMPQLEIHYNRMMLAQYHLTVDEVNRVVNTAFAGQSAGLLFEDEKRFDIVVRMDAQQKNNIEQIKNTLVNCPNGDQIPLHLVADVEIKNGINQIQRESARRRIVVGFNINNRDVQSVVEELKSKTEKQLHFPSGYSVSYGGAFENLEQAKQRLAIAVPVSLLLIFVFLYFAFKNIPQALLIYTAIPLSAIGGILSLFFRGMPFSISAGIGFIALFGVAVLNGIVLISEFNRVKASGIHNLTRVVFIGTKTRLRPVLMTAFVASLGFLPMALSNGAGAEVQRPLATVVIGGLLLATLLTLFVLPILYILMEKRSLKKIKSITLTVFLLLAFYAPTLQAQQALPFQDALDMALQQNLKIKQEGLRTEWTKLIAKAQVEIPRSNFTADLGQINSNYFDTKWSAMQSFAFPIVYKQQRLLGLEQVHVSEVQKEIQVFQLRKLISEIYIRYAHLLNKQKLLHQADSLYSNMHEKALLRFKQGEQNGIEKALTANQKSSVEIQQKQLNCDLQILLLQFHYVLNTNLPYVPDGLPLLQDKQEEHPQKLFVRSLISLEKARKKTVQTQQLPEWSAGLSNTSFRGVGPDNKYYNAAHRFTSVQAGITVPLFQKSLKAKIKAADLSIAMAEKEAEITTAELQQVQDSIGLQLQQNQEAMHLFETVQLSNANTLQKIAQQQFLEGEINYLDYSMILQQVILTQSNYLELQLQQQLLHNEKQYPFIQ